MRPTSIPVKPQSIPAGLKSIPRWVVWRFVERTQPNGQKVWAKMPMTASGAAASSTDPKTWTDYGSALDALIMGDFDGIGIVLGDDLHGIDLDDCRDPETGALSELAEETLRRVDGYAEVSPSATGIKILTLTNLDASRTKKEAGVELYRNGRYFTVTGHQINGHEAMPDTVQDIGWLVDRLWGDTLSEGTPDAFELLKTPLDGWDLERVEQNVLAHLDPDCGYDEWLRIGAALHHQGEGGEDWLTLWDSWSSGSSKWVDGYCAEKWRSFSEQRATGRGAITLASLLHLTRDARKEVAKVERTELMDSILEQINACTVPLDLEDVVRGAVRGHRLTDLQQEFLTGAVQTRGREIGLRLRVAVIRGWLRPPARVASDGPEWVADWVYVTDGDKFLNLRSKQEVTPAGFRALHNRLMPVDESGARVRADVQALEQWDLPVVAHKSYMPGAGPVFEMLGVQWANLYREDSAPAIPDELTDEDEDAIALVRSHFSLYLASDREQELLLSWIAHQVQHPGVKVRWAPYVHGVPGDGKSFFLDLLGCVLGAANVKPVNGSTLESNFTDWAVGAAVVGIEEMKQHGHNKFDVMNKLKPFISNTVVEVHPKGRPAYAAPNVTSYIVFSNYLDGAPVDDSDRRYMFVSSQLTLERVKQITEEGYYVRLFDTIAKHAGAIRGWLKSYPLHVEFAANGRAPDTEVKETVVELSKPEMQIQLEDLLERGIPGVTPKVISSGHLSAALKGSGFEAPATSSMHAMLSRMGYRPAFGKKQKKWRGYPCRIWVRGNVSEEEIFAELERSATDDFLQ